MRHRLFVGTFLAALVVVAHVATAVPVVVNSGFEAGPVNPYPGYGAISDWTRIHPPGNSGTNDAAGPFVNGLPIPELSRAAFIQGGGTLQQTVSGFDVGTDYIVQYRENERGMAGAVARIQVDLGGTTVVPVHDITRTAQFTTVVSAPFTATAASHSLEFIRSAGIGDNTALIDHVLITEADRHIFSPSFEEGPLNGWPGYGPVTGWIENGGGGSNDASGPFLNGLPIPDGGRVAFIQTSGSLAQTIVGLTPAQNYILQYAENERGQGASPVARAQVDIGGTTVVAAHDVTRTAQFATVVAQFSAAADHTQLELIHPGGGTGDNTVLFDSLYITPAGSPFVKNASFEDGPVNPWPGYGQVNSWNWDTPGGGNRGTNDAGGPFIAGAGIADGARTAFLQGIGSLSQTVVGLIPGQEYSLTLATATRSGQGNDLRVLVDGQLVSGGRITYTTFQDLTTATFVASDISAVLTLQTTNPRGGDRTTLMDHVRVNALGIAAAPTITNPSFEDGATPPWPGYTAVSGWASDTSDSGVNDASGPFLGGMAIPDGSRVGFIQRIGDLSQTLTGLTPGEVYELDLAVAHRPGYDTNDLQVLVDGEIVAGGASSFNQLTDVTSARFIASGTTASLILRTTNPKAIDTTTVVDNLRIHAVGPVAAPTITNGSFEDGPTAPWPGYGPVNGWGSDSHETGSNDAGGPFLSGLPIPDGGHIGFIQGGGTLSQTVTGLEAGKAYTIQYFENERGAAHAGAPTGRLSVEVDGAEIVPTHDVNRTDAFRRVVSAPFTATSMAAALAMIHPGGVADNSVLLDNVVITRAVPVLTNLGFEAPFPDPEGNGFEYRPVGPGLGWTFTGGAGVSMNARGFMAGQANAPEGGQIGFLQGAGAIIEQALAGFEPGKMYSLSWAQKTRLGGPFNTNDLLVELIGSGDVLTLFGGLVESGAWEEVTSDAFVASADAYTLRFSTRNPLGGDSSTFIDDVRFNFISEIPEPATVALLGLGALGVLRRRKR